MGARCGEDRGSVVAVDASVQLDLIRLDNLRGVGGIQRYHPEPALAATDQVDEKVCRGGQGAAR